MNRWLQGSAVVLVIAGLLLGGCSSSPDSPAQGSTSNSYLATQSPGDVWVWTLNASDFTATNQTLNLTYSGTRSTLPNGFLKLVVTASDDPALTAQIGTATPPVAYAVEVPGTALIIKPAGTGSKPIVGVGSGNCPTGTASYNFVVLPHATWTKGVDAAYGRADVTATGANISATVSKSFLGGASAGAAGTDTGTCAAGKVTFASGAIVGVTPSGTLVGDNGTGMGGFVGVKAPATGITPAGLLTATREFRGVLFKNNALNTTEPVWVRTLAAGTSLQGGSYTDIEGNIEDTVNTVTINTWSEPNPGLFSAVLNGGGIINPAFTFMANQAGGKFILYGISEQDDNSGEAYNVLLVEK